MVSSRTAWATKQDNVTNKQKPYVVTMLPRLAYNSWAQAILLPLLPESLGLQVPVTTS
jgi:hypothetical protein